MKTLTREELTPKEAFQLDEFLKKYPGDSRAESVRLEKAYMAGFTHAMNKTIDNVANELENAAGALRALKR